MPKSEKLIISKQRVKDFGEVFTPTCIVREMCNLVHSQCLEDTTTFLEPSCGNGNFLVEILSRKLENIASDCDEDDVMLGRMYVALGSLYGCDIQADNVEWCRSRLAELFVIFARGCGLVWNEQLVKIILDANIRQADTLKDKVGFCKVRFDEFTATNKVQLDFFIVDFAIGTSMPMIKVEYDLVYQP